MGFKLVSKHNIGIGMTFILALLVSQARMFDFLMDTPLGRLLLLAAIIVIASTNKILGLIAVVAVILAFNVHGTSTVYASNAFFEGFDNASTNAAIQNIKDKVQQAKQNQVATTTSSSATTTTASSTTPETFKGGREGFCMTDRETNMLRGKQSNTISVSDREQPDDVGPSDKSIFGGAFAAF